MVYSIFLFFINIPLHLLVSCLNTQSGLSEQPKKRLRPYRRFLIPLHSPALPAVSAFTILQNVYEPERSTFVTVVTKLFIPFPSISHHKWSANPSRMRRTDRVQRRPMTAAAAARSAN
jgi:hypothetical protein